MTNHANIGRYSAIKDRFKHEELNKEDIEFLFSLIEEKTEIVEIGVASKYDVIFEAAIKQLGHTIVDTHWHEEKNETYFKVEK